MDASSAQKVKGGWANCKIEVTLDQRHLLDDNVEIGAADIPVNKRHAGYARIDQRSPVRIEVRVQLNDIESWF